MLKPVWNTFNGVLLTVPGAIINKSTGIVVEEKIDEANKAIINQAYGNNEPLKKAAYRAQVVGEDVFNVGMIPTIFVPMDAVGHLGTFFRTTRNLPKAIITIDKLIKQLPVIERLGPIANTAKNQGVRTSQAVVRNPTVQKATGAVNEAHQVIVAVPASVMERSKVISGQPQVLRKSNPQTKINVQVGDGYAMPKKYAMQSHGEVVQDVVYVRLDRKGAGIGDGVSGAGPKSIYVATDGSQGLTDALVEAVRNNNSFQQIYDSVNEAAHRLNNQIYSKYAYIDVKGDIKLVTSTVISSTIQDHRLFVARIGDTEGRIIRNNSINKLENFIKEAEFGPANQMLGINTPVQIGSTKLSRDIRMTVHPLQSGDRIILSSDGIGKVLSDSEIHKIVMSSRSATEAERNLVMAAIDSSMKKYGKIVDDFSVHVEFN